MITEKEAYDFAWEALGYLVYEGKFKPKGRGQLLFSNAADKDGRFSYFIYPSVLSPGRHRQFSTHEIMKPEDLLFRYTSRQNYKMWEMEDWRFDVILQEKKPEGCLMWLLTGLFDRPSIEAIVSREIADQRNIAFHEYENPGLAKKIQGDLEYRNYLRKILILKQLKEDYTLMLVRNEFSR